MSKKKLDFDGFFKWLKRQPKPDPPPRSGMYPACHCETGHCRGPFYGSKCKEDMRRFNV